MFSWQANGGKIAAGVIVMPLTVPQPEFGTGGRHRSRVGSILKPPGALTMPIDDQRQPEGNAATFSENVPHKTEKPPSGGS